jgi:hypothetical protein
MSMTDLADLLTPADRNPGIPLDLDWVESIHLRRNAARLHCLAVEL